jgi:NADPH:quinone reductase-like Zn-dependent oxidoreductase
LAQSIKCIARQGVISVIGFIAPGEGGGEGMPGMLDALSSGCIVRGIFVGNREKFEELVRGVEAAGVEPVVDERVFGMGEVREAYEYMEGQKHFGKVVIEL